MEIYNGIFSVINEILGILNVGKKKPFFIKLFTFLLINAMLNFKIKS